MSLGGLGRVFYGARRPDSAVGAPSYGDPELQSLLSIPTFPNPSSPSSNTFILIPHGKRCSYATACLAPSDPFPYYVYFYMS